jgi:hypothetical protein
MLEGLCFTNSLKGSALYFLNEFVDTLKDLSVSQGFLSFSGSAMAFSWRDKPAPLLLLLWTFGIDLNATGFTIR